MIHYTRVLKGTMNYVDAEIVSKMQGSIKAWGVEIVTGLLADRGEAVFLAAREHPLVKLMDVVDGENIDVDRLYAKAMQAAQRGSATVNIMFIGPVTFKTADVESLYRHIMGA